MRGSGIRRLAFWLITSVRFEYGFGLVGPELASPEHGPSSHPGRTRSLALNSTTILRLCDPVIRQMSIDQRLRRGPDSQSRAVAIRREYCAVQEPHVPVVGGNPL